MFLLKPIFGKKNEEQILKKTHSLQHYTSHDTNHDILLVLAENISCGTNIYLKDAPFFRTQ